MLTVLLAVQAALTSWVQLCEAMASWRMIQDEGLCNELTLLMQAFKANLVCAHTPVQYLVDCSGMVSPQNMLKIPGRHSNSYGPGNRLDSPQLYLD